MAQKPTKTLGRFASGIAIPFRADHDGGVVLEEGDAYIRSLVLATVSPNGSENPFQDLGTDESAVFQNPDDPEWKRVTRRRIERQFGELERNNLARLVSVVFDRGNESGDLGVTIEYINLESTTEGSLAVSVRAGDTVGVRRSIPSRSG